ncbi:MAG: AsmA family protein [Elusimicrobiota bacterium]|nr:MAG: AsmA family protein [Elusimicrobiota bacterium]
MARARLWLKVGGTAVLLAVLGAGAALVALKAFFPEPKIRALIVDGARKQLGREVRLDRLSLGLTGLHLAKLEISERPDFAAGTFVAVETFSVRPSWRALLRKRLVIASASADGLRLRVAKGADGRFNYETLASSAAAPSPEKPAEASPPAEFNVRRLRVTRGPSTTATASARGPSPASSSRSTTSRSRSRSPSTSRCAPRARPASAPSTPRSPSAAPSTRPASSARR